MHFFFHVSRFFRNFFHLIFSFPQRQIMKQLIANCFIIFGDFV